MNAETVYQTKALCRGNPLTPATLQIQRGHIRLSRKWSRPPFRQPDVIEHTGVAISIIRPKTLRRLNPPYVLICDDEVFSLVFVRKGDLVRIEDLISTAGFRPENIYVSAFYSMNAALLAHHLRNMGVLPGLEVAKG